MVASLETGGGEPKSSRRRGSAEHNPHAMHVDEGPRCPGTNVSSHKSSTSPPALSQGTQITENLVPGPAKNRHAESLDGRQKGNDTASGKKRKVPGSELVSEISKPVSDQPAPKRKRQEERFQKA